jgi:uncharacterized membrane protein YfcA
MLEPLAIVAIALTFLLAGTVKGVIGLGLPTVSLGLLTMALDLTTAMALLVVPSFVTNVWQAVAGGHGRAILRRIWPFLAAATATVWIGAAALTRVDLALLSGLLGVLLMAYSALNLAGPRIAIAPRSEPWAGPLFGAVNGVLTGMTGASLVPGVIFLQGIGLTRDLLVQALGMLFLASTIALGFALHGSGLLTAQLGVVSAAAVIPAAVGMLAGQRIRRGLSEQKFRRVFFFAVFVLGAVLVAKAAVGGH